MPGGSHPAQEGENMSSTITLIASYSKNFKYDYWNNFCLICSSPPPPPPPPHSLADTSAQLQGGGKEEFTGSLT